MLLCIVGKSGSGKDTVARVLETWDGFEPVCSYTTRPQRANELQGKEHHFISRKEAEQILETRADEVVAQTEIAGNLYFALKEDLEKASLYIIDPAGIAYIQEHFPDIPLYQMYVQCDDDIAEQRAKQRGDDMDVYKARHESENEAFEAYYQAKKYDYLIHNNRDRDALQIEIARFLEEWCTL